MKDEFDFNEKSPSFNDLIKKYQAAEEDAADPDVQAEPVRRAVVPENETKVDFEKEFDDLLDNVQSVTVSVEETQSEAFTFDESLVNGEEKALENEFAAAKETPKFSYDLDMFGTAPKSNFDLDDFDDSWLDSSLDESIFYDPAAQIEDVQPSAPVSAAETAQEIFPEQPEEIQDILQEEKPAVQPEPVEKQEPKEVPIAPVNEPADSGISAVPGGYIAPTAAANFSFDPDSGFGFDDDEPQVNSELAGLPVFTPVKPDAKGNKKPKKKKETKAMTGFSKQYQAGGEDSATKKKGNLFTRNFIPLKGDSTAEIIRKIVMTVAVIAVICSAGYLFNDFVIMPYMNDKSIAELNELLGDSNKVIDPDEWKDKYPDVVFPEGMLEKYADLYARNQDLVGWVQIDELGISLPVVQADNNEQYLDKDFDNKKSKYGSVFMNSANNSQSLSYNTTLFGHHMKDGKMFANLADYKTAKGYKKAPVIEFNTLYGNYKWKVFAVFITNGTSREDEGYLFNYMFTDLSSEEAVEEFLGEIKLRSIYYPKVDLAVSDKILTLSTCTYEFDEARLVIMARMVRPGESEEVDTSEILYNPNPRYPNAYYEKNGLSNPYAKYSKWKPN